MLYSRGFYQDIREAKEMVEHGVYHLALLSTAPRNTEQDTQVGTGCGFLTWNSEDILAHRSQSRCEGGPVNSQHEMSAESFRRLLCFT